MNALFYWGNYLPTWRLTFVYVLSSTYFDTAQKMMLQVEYFMNYIA